jgi:hypothetical protein
MNIIAVENVDGIMKSFVTGVTEADAIIDSKGQGFTLLSQGCNYKITGFEIVFDRTYVKFLVEPIYAS